MARAMTPETEIRNLKRELANLRGVCIHATKEADGWHARAKRFELEAAEWKRRFDALLLKLPDVPKEPI